MFLPQAGPRDIPIAIIEVPDEPDARQYKVLTYYRVCHRVGVHFINILRAAFTRADPKSSKR